MKCFYHNDLDGKCAAAVVSLHTKNRNPSDFIEVDYIMDLPIDKIEAFETVWFVDYSFKEDTKHILEQLIRKSCLIFWIDHHTSSLNLINKYPELNKILGRRQDGISGAALTYMYCHHISYDEIPYFIKLVSDYDCWKYRYNPDTTRFKLGMDMKEHGPFDGIWQELFEDDDNLVSDKALEELLDSGRMIKSYIDMDNTHYRNSFAYESEICGHKCLVINRKSNSWIFGEKYNEYPLVMVWAFDGITYSYSIFSSDKAIDCSKIAESYGGGGHKGAAGFSSKELLFKKV